MACKLVLKAPNGRDSILFKDIAEASTTVDDAINMYFYTKTEEFGEEYQGKLDINGEPDYKEMAGKNYVHDVDYAKVELDHAADVFKKLMTTVPDIIGKIEQRIDYLQYKGDNTHVLKLQDLLDVLQTEAVNTSIPKFFEMASKHVAGLHTIAREAFKKELSTADDLKVFSGLYKTASSYDVISDLKRMLTDNSEVAKLFENSFAMIDGTTDKINDIQNFYLSKSKEFVTDELARRESTWSKKDIRAALDHAPQDATWADYLVMHIGDSKDRVLYSASKIIMEAEHKIRRETISFTKELESKLVALEKEHKGSSDTIFEDVIIEHNNELHVLDTSITAESISPLHKAMYAKLQKVKGRKALMEYLQFYNDTMRVLDVGLPNSAVMGTRMPTIMKSEWELIQGGTMQETAMIIQDNMVNKIAASNLDMEKGQLTDTTGKPVKRIPTFYTQMFNSIDYKAAQKEQYALNIKKGQTHDQATENAVISAEVVAKSQMVKKMSRDLAGNLQSFHAMATNFSAKYELVHLFDAIEAIVGSESRTYGETEGGKALIDARTGKQRTKSGEESIAFKQLMNAYDMQLYGMKESDLGTINVLGKDLDVNKGLRSVTSFSSFLQIPFNIGAAVGNINYGEYSNVLEAVGGEYFGFKNYQKATKYYFKNLGSTFADVGARSTSGIVNLLEEHYNMLQNYGGNNISTAERTRLRRTLKKDKAYFMSSSGEHLLQVRAGIAMLDAVEYYNKDGVAQGSLLDIHTAENGVLKMKEGVYIKEKDGSLVKYDTLQQNRVSDRIGGVLRKAHGNYSPQTSGAAKRDARLAMVLQFRGFAAESIKKRFGKASPNYLLERETEGFYRTGAKALFGFARDLHKFKLQVAKENWSALSDHEKANIRRFVTESAMITLTATASVMFGKMGKEIDDAYDTDDWKDRVALGSFRFAQYQVLRLRTEVGAYTSVVEALKLLRSPAATLNILESTTEIITQLSEPFEQYETGYRKGDYKLSTKLGKMVPFYKQLASYTPDGIKQKTQWLN